MSSPLLIVRCVRGVCVDAKVRSIVYLIQQGFLKKINKISSRSLHHISDLIKWLCCVCVCADRGGGGVGGRMSEIT